MILHQHEFLRGHNNKYNGIRKHLNWLNRLYGYKRVSSTEEQSTEFVEGRKFKFANIKQTLSCDSPTNSQSVK